MEVHSITVYVTGFGKMYIVYTSNFSTLVSHKDLSAMTDRCETLRDYKTTIPLSSLRVSNVFTIQSDFLDLQMCKIRCINYACFPKSGHIFLIICML